MMFLTFGSTFRPRCTVWATIFTVTLALTLATPGTARAAAISAARSASIWLFAG